MLKIKVFLKICFPFLFMFAICVSHMCRDVHRGQKRVLDSQELGGCEPHDMGRWEQNSCPLEEQQGLLTEEPTLQSLKISLILSFSLRWPS